MIIATVFSVVFMGGANRSGPMQFLLMTMILPLPPLVAGVALFISGSRRSSDEDFADLRTAAERD